MEKIAVLLADGMFHAAYAEKEVSNAKRQARILTNHGRKCKLFWESKNSLAVIQEKYGFDTEYYFLGVVCRNGHFWANSHLSLRYIGRERRCVTCLNEKIKRMASRNNENKVKNYHKNVNESRAKRREQYHNDPQRFIRQSARWRDDNKDKSRLIAQRCSAKKRTEYRISYSSAELLEHFEKFNNECAYCGNNKEILTLDHVYPVSKIPVDCLGNIVPACKSCNSGKRDRDLLQWFKKKSFYTDERMSRILQLTDYKIDLTLCNGN